MKFGPWFAVGLIGAALALALPWAMDQAQQRQEERARAAQNAQAALEALEAWLQVEERQ